MSTLTQMLTQADWVSGISWLFYLILAMVGMILICVILFMALSMVQNNIKICLLWPIGNPYYTYHKTPGGTIIKKKVVSVEEQETTGRIYNKRIEKGKYKEYFKINGTDYDRENIYDPSYFYRRIKRGVLDFQPRGIKLFMDSVKGPIPLAVQNPILEQAPLGMNSIISTYVNTQKDIREKYESDFWSKYGSVITLSIIMVIIVACFIFMIKIQEISWTNANAQMKMFIQEAKTMVAPPLK